MDLPTPLLSRLLLLRDMCHPCLLLTVRPIQHPAHLVALLMEPLTLPSLRLSLYQDMRLLRFLHLSHLVQCMPFPVRLVAHTLESSRLLPHCVTHSLRHPLIVLTIQHRPLYGSWSSSSTDILPHGIYLSHGSYPHYFFPIVTNSTSDRRSDHSSCASTRLISSRLTR